jgi:hypothetical protein
MQQTRSPTTTSMSAMSAFSMTGATTQTTSGRIEKALIETSTTTLVGVPAGTQPSDDNTALIGGVVGGVVALLLIIGLFFFFIVTRNRRIVAHNQDQPSNRNDVSMAPAQASSSNYGKINVQSASNHYDESFLKHSPTSQNYDDAGVLANNMALRNAKANQTNYDDPSVLSVSH